MTAQERPRPRNAPTCGTLPATLVMGLAARFRLRSKRTPRRIHRRVAVMMPSAIAWVTAAVLSFTPSLAKDRSRCVSPWPR